MYINSVIIFLILIPFLTETQIETTRSTTTVNKDLEELVLPTMRQQKNLWEILTKTANIEQTTAEYMSTLTTQIDYHNLTNITNEESVT